MKRSYIILFCLLLPLTALSEGGGASHGSRGGKGDGSGGGRGAAKMTDSGKKGTVSILMPESMKAPNEFLVTLFKRKHDSDVQVSYGITLPADRIVGTAPADIVITDDAIATQALRSEGLIAKESTLYADSLIIAVPKRNLAGVKQPQDLAAPTVKSILLPESGKLPQGAAGKNALQSLKLWGNTESKIVSVADIPSALTKLAKGEAEAGILFLRDTKGNKEIQTIYAFPVDSYAPRSYPMILTKTGKDNVMAEAYFELLNSHYADKAFSTYGFSSKFKEVLANRPADEANSVSAWLQKPGHHQKKGPKEPSPLTGKIP